MPHGHPGSNNRHRTHGRGHHPGGAGAGKPRWGWLRHPLVWLAPLATAGVTAFVVTLATGYAHHFGSGGGSPRLEVDSVTVTSSASALKSTVDFKMRNTGNQLAIITGVRLSILQFAKLTHCESQGALTSTGTYRANMPESPRPGARVNIPVSQQVGPDSAEEFKIELRIPRDMSAAIYFYRVHLDLLYDNAATPVDAGEAFISLPFAPNGEYYWTPKDAAVPDPFPFTGLGAPGISRCMINNSKTLRALLSLGGARSGQVRAIPPQLSFCCVVKTPVIRAARCPGVSPAVRPVSMTIGCDGTGDLEKMKWSAWTSSHAKGMGIARINDCTPSCATGKFHAYPVTVLFKNPIVNGQVLEWNTAILTFPSGHPPGGSREVFNNFAPITGG